MVVPTTYGVILYVTSSLDADTMMIDVPFPQIDPVDAVGKRGGGADRGTSHAMVRLLDDPFPDGPCIKTLSNSLAPTALGTQSSRYTPQYNGIPTQRPRWEN